MSFPQTKVPNYHLIIRKNLYKKYSKNTCRLYNTKTVNNLLILSKMRIVSLFKEAIIMNFQKEFVKKYYPLNESYKRLHKIFDYYVNYLKFFCCPFFRKFYFDNKIQNMNDLKADIFYRENYVNDDKRNNRQSRNDCNLEIIFNKKAKKQIENSTLELLSTINRNNNNSYLNLELTNNYLFSLVQNIKENKYNQIAHNNKNCTSSKKFSAYYNINSYNNNYSNNNNLNNKPKSISKNKGSIIDLYKNRILESKDKANKIHKKSKVTDQKTLSGNNNSRSKPKNYEIIKVYHNSNYSSCVNINPQPIQNYSTKVNIQSNNNMSTNTIEKSVNKVKTMKFSSSIKNRVNNSNQNSCTLFNIYKRTIREKKMVKNCSKSITNLKISMNNTNNNTANTTMNNMNNLTICLHKKPVKKSCVIDVKNKLRSKITLDKSSINYDSAYLSKKNTINVNNKNTINTISMNTITYNNTQSNQNINKSKGKNIRKITNGNNNNNNNNENNKNIINVYNQVNNENSSTKLPLNNKATTKNNKYKLYKNNLINTTFSTNNLILNYINNCVKYNNFKSKTSLTTLNSNTNSSIFPLKSTQNSVKSTYKIIANYSKSTVNKGRNKRRCTYSNGSLNNNLNNMLNYCNDDINALNGKKTSAVNLHYCANKYSTYYNSIKHEANLKDIKVNLNNNIMHNLSKKTYYMHNINNIDKSKSKLINKYI